MSNPGPSIIRQPIVNYNNFFNPYVCHVCKISENMQVCPSCHLISYCCNEHLRLHREQHEEFCLGVLSVSSEIYYTHDITLEEWTEIKKANVERVKHKLGRDLEPYEEQILLFAKSCLICRRQNNLTVVCKSCKSVSMCYRHISTPYVHSCEYQRLCIKLDILKAKTNGQEDEQDEQDVYPEELLDINFAYLSDMSTYLQHCLGRGGDLDTWSYDDFLYTNYFSRPLTLLFKIMETNMYQLSSSTIFIIHVIAGPFMNKNSLSAWEVILHQMLPDALLFIIMVGSKLEEIQFDMMLCETCYTENKRLIYEFVPMTYRDYVRIEEYIKPEIIIGFDVDFADDRTAIIEALIRQNRPLLLTCRSENRAQQIVTEITSILYREPALIEKNKFASCRPYRNVDSDSVFFLHQCSIMYSKRLRRKPSKSNLNTHSNHNQPNASNSLFHV